MITIKSDREIELMREAGYMVSKTHKYLKPFIKEGITTKENVWNVNTDTEYHEEKTNQ